jgi:hypothetical protein
MTWRAFYFVCISIPCMSAVTLAADSPTRDPNVARGKPYVFSAPPNYAHCTDAGDATDLTDGVRTGRSPNGGYWTERGTVGWNHVRAPIAITVDLGATHRISGAALGSGAGGAGVSLPSSVAILVSEDGESFHLVGDLVELAENPWPPEYGQFSTYTYESNALDASGRYVRFVLVPSAVFAFVDEIEVFGTPAADDDKTSAVDARHGAPVTDEQLADSLRLTRLGTYRRTMADIQRIETKVRDLHLAPDQAEPLLSELAAIEQELRSGGASFPEQPESFHATAPLNDLHRRALAIHGKLLAAGGHPPLTVWQTPPYKLLELFVKPTRAEPSLSIHAMDGEWRAQTLNITNASAEEQEVTVAIAALPTSEAASPLKVYQVEYVDTREGRWVASALVEIEPKDTRYSTTVPAGLTRQIWFSFNPQGAKPGKYEAEVRLAARGLDQRVPLKLTVAPLQFPERLACSLGLWDYVYDGNYEITDENRPLAVRDMTDRHVDVVWCASGTVPMPQPNQIDAEGNITSSIDYSRWDQFVRLWPNARYYAAFATLHVDSGFAGLQQGTPQFDRAITQWAQNWAEHNRSIRLKAGQAMILFLDEPGATEHFQATYNFAKPFNAATDEILVYCDPVGTATMNVPFAREALEQCDVISPPQGHYSRGGAQLHEFYRELRDQGKKLWLYDCSGPTRQMDPAYYRMQPWHALEAGATAAQFWAYGDAGAASNWNEYAAVGRTSYTTVYLAPDSVTTSKHWEAVREGLQDYQYFVMLKEKALELRAAGKEARARQAEQLAAQLPVDVVKNLHERYSFDFAVEWRNPSSLAEEARLRALRFLGALEQ